MRTSDPQLADTTMGGLVQMSRDAATELDLSESWLLIDFDKGLGDTVASRVGEAG